MINKVLLNFATSQKRA